MQSESRRFPSDGRIPLVVGVTGHRSIPASNAELRGQIQSELVRLRDRFLDTPFLVVSPLAEGADRLLAQLALETLRAKLLVVLPLPAEEYRRDFRSGESQIEFDALMAAATQVLVIPQKFSRAQVAQDPNARNHQYAAVGAWIVEHAQVLIAIWDGKPAHGWGGTGDVMAWRRQSAPPPQLTALNAVSLLNEDYLGLTWSVHPETHHLSRFAGSKSYEAVEGIFDCINAFNRDVRRFVGEPALQADSHWSQCLHAAATPFASLETAQLENLRRSYGAADYLAMRFQRSDSTLVLAVAWCLFLAQICQQLAKPLSNGAVFSAGGMVYIAFALLFLLADFWAKRRRLEDRYLEYRALAEGVRVGIAWRLGGIGRSVSTGYRAEHVDALLWVREALRGLETSVLTQERLDQTQKAHLGIVESWWVGRQAEYLRRKADLFRRRGTFFDRSVFICTLVSISLALASVVWERSALSWLAPLMVVISGVLLGAVAIGKYYSQKKTYSALASHFDLSARLFAKALILLKAKPDKAPELLVELGEEVISENMRWLQANRKVPIKPN